MGQYFRSCKFTIQPRRMFRIYIPLFNLGCCDTFYTCSVYKRYIPWQIWSCKKSIIFFEGKFESNDATYMPTEYFLCDLFYSVSRVIKYSSTKMLVSSITIKSTKTSSRCWVVRLHPEYKYVILKNRTQRAGYENPSVYIQYKILQVFLFVMLN